MWTFEDEKIVSFGDTPAPKATTDDVVKAEDEVADEEVEQKQKENEERDEQEEKEEERESKLDESEGDDLGDADEAMPGLDSESDTPTDTDEVEEAPDEDKDGSKKSDEELDAMPKEMRLKLRYTPRFYTAMEYGTPAGSNPKIPGGCPSCEDAADAVAIDAGIEETEGSGESDETDSEDLGDAMGDMGDTGEGGDLGDLGSEGDETADALMRLTYLSTWNGNVGTEGYIANAIHHFGVVLNMLFRGTVKYSRKVWKWARNKIAKSTMRMQTIAKLWKYKLSGNIDDIDGERFGNYEVTAFPYDLFVQTSKTAIALADALTNSERIVFDRNEEVMCDALELCAKFVDSVGVEINVGKNRINTDKLYDNRTHNALKELGYDKTKIPVLIRYMEELSKRMKGGDLDIMYDTMGKTLQKITSYSTDLTEAVKRGDIKEGSEEYKVKTKVVVLATSRYDYLLSACSVLAMLMDQLTSDVLKVFSKAEDCMISAKYVD